MSGIWISAATIARFAVAGSLMTLMAGGQSAPKAASTIWVFGSRSDGPRRVNSQGLLNID